MNWGNKLFITFLVFAGGMSFLVYRAVKTNFELVEKEYYKTELAYQQTIDATNRVNQMNSPVRIDQVANNIVLYLPAEMKDKDIEGQAWFYCAYDAARDRRLSLALDKEATQVFPAETLLPGTYTVKMRWKADGQSYYAEKRLTVR